MDNQRVGGMVTLTFPDRSQIVVNLQAAAGGVARRARRRSLPYKWDGQRWRDTKGSGEFFAELSRHASLQAGRASTSVLNRSRMPRSIGGRGGHWRRQAAGVHHARVARHARRLLALGAARSGPVGPVLATGEAQAADAVAARIFLVVPLAANVHQAFGRSAPSPARP